MSAVFKREFKSYFNNPVGYVCVAALAALYGFFFYQVMLMGSSSYVGNIYYTIFTYGMMIVPILTMRTFSEDRKNKTDQALLTAPVNVSGIVMGKFFSAFAIYAIATLMGVLPALALSAFATLPWGIIIGNVIGTLLYGGAMISIGVFISSLTVSQVIAALGTFAISLMLLFIENLAASSGIVGTIVKWISFTSRYYTFTQGIFNIPSCVYFISIMAIFCFFTMRKIESRRWN